MEFFEITPRFVGCLVLELLTKNVSKNRSLKFPHPTVLDPEKSKFSKTTWNSTKFDGNVVGTQLRVLAKFHLHSSDT